MCLKSVNASMCSTGRIREEMGLRSVSSRGGGSLIGLGAGSECREVEWRK
jgi:hypothetical protein